MLMRNFLITLLLITVSLLVSCRAYKPVPYTPPPSPSSPSSPASSPVVKTEDDYISRYKDLAISEMRRTGVPASITLAQGMIESNYGRSTLSREANNHFGIKCNNGWTGPGVRHHDDERNECFRKYSNAQESFLDHSDFLRTGSRYSFLFSLSPYDYKGWARGLKKAGYATNPQYAEILIRKIEENNLTIYDRADLIAGSNAVEKPVERLAGRSVEQSGTAEKTFAAAMDESLGKETVRIRSNENVRYGNLPRVMENNRIQYVIVNEGDTRESLEKEFSLLRWELPRYNELDSEFGPAPGQILYLQPKRDKADVGKNTYTTVEGDTMYLVSQKFGIKLKSLYEMNRMEAGTEPAPGTKLWLRSLKPVN